MRQFIVLSLTALLLSGCPDLSDTQNGFIAPLSYDTSVVGDAALTDAGKTDTASSQSDTAGAKDTGSTKKDAGAVPAALSCKGKCGAKYNSSLKCQCNDDCAKFGNCCVDYGPLCKPEALSCKGRCNTAPDKKALCQCSWNCGRYGNCCPDYLGMCHAGKDLDMPLADEGETTFCNKPTNLYNVKYAKDGDTIELLNGDIVRYLVVNTPELSKNDCYAVEALQWTKAMVKKVNVVCLIIDPAEGDKDQYNRLLRYVYYKDPAAGGKWVNMNLRMVRLGLGPVFYPYATGQKWEKMAVLLQQKARETKAGGWGKCGWK